MRKRKPMRRHKHSGSGNAQRISVVWQCHIRLPKVVSVDHSCRVGSSVFYPSDRQQEISLTATSLNQRYSKNDSVFCESRLFLAIRCSLVMFTFRMAIKETSVEACDMNRCGVRHDSMELRNPEEMDRLILFAATFLLVFFAAVRNHH